MTLEKLERYAKILGILVAAFGVYRYFDSLQQEKITRVLTYYDEFHTGTNMEARQHIGEIFYRVKNDRDAILARDDITVDDVLVRLLNRPETRIRADVIIEFFDRIHACAAVESCDRETTRRLFASEARFLLDLQFRPFVNVDAVRIGGPGQGLACLSGLRRDLCFRQPRLNPRP